MTDNRKFLAYVHGTVDKTKDDMLRVAKQSLQDVIRVAQTPVAQGGEMPVSTGFLRNSLITTVGGQSSAENADSYILGLANLELGTPFNVAWVAEYAIARHYAVGVGQGGGLWRDKAAQKWPQIVAENAKRVQ